MNKEKINKILFNLLIFGLIVFLSLSAALVSITQNIWLNLGGDIFVGIILVYLLFECGLILQKELNIFFSWIVTVPINIKNENLAKN